MKMMKIERIFMLQHSLRIRFQSPVELSESFQS